MFLIVLAAAATGCGSGGQPPAARGPEAGGATAAPHTLYTHCGIYKTEFEGRTWYANPPLHDGSGNPPPGWGNPYAEGTFDQLTLSSAVFRSNNGLSVFLSITPGPDTGPEQCD